MKKILIAAAFAFLFATSGAYAAITGGSGAVTVSSTSTVVLTASDLGAPPTQGRAYILVQNVGASQDAYCNFGATATTTNGFIVKAGGGYIELEAKNSGTGNLHFPPQSALNCITASGTTTVAVVEY